MENRVRNEIALFDVIPVFTACVKLPLIDSAKILLKNVFVGSWVQQEKKNGRIGANVLQGTDCDFEKMYHDSMGE